MKLHILENRKTGGYATFGSTWKKGEVQSDSAFVLFGEQGTEIPVQSRVTAWWPDGSVKWAAHTADSKRIGKNAEICPVKPEHGGALQDFEDIKEVGCRIQNPSKKIVLTENKEAFHLQSDRISFTVPKTGTELLRNLYIDGKKRADYIDLTASLERRTADGKHTDICEGIGLISGVETESAGPLVWEFRIEGIHVFTKDAAGAGTNRELKGEAEKLIPFIVRIKAGADSDRMDVTHTFLYDGDENRDFLKGMGIRIVSPLQGEAFDRHISFGTDFGVFHEASKLLLTWRPRIPSEIYQAQIDGRTVESGVENASRGAKDSAAASQLWQTVSGAADQIPSWSRYQLVQDSDSHFVIRKRVNREECCFIEGLHGSRAKGCVAVGGTDGGIVLGMRNFWKKYPSGLEVNHLDGEKTEVTCWFRTPEVESFDFRHYAAEGYDQTYYEGFPDKGATPYGIANTGQLSITGFSGKTMLSPEELAEFAETVEKPAVYVGTPEYYQEHHAFGFFSLPEKNTPMEIWMEEQLDRAIAFYQKEIETRKWYGMFNYGDFMHTYDPFRHTWRYDMGGYAWQNTELVPTMWLWLAFLRSGREDIFTMAEAMTRHCSEVDIYHLGELKGLGSRHNVRHWGCSCKEARIAMAGHHRYYYYLTGDRRLEDIFTEVKDADEALKVMDPLRYFYEKDKMECPTHARSGPDWSSLVSDWMTQWERSLDKTYEEKIRTGIEDLKQAPLQLVSGPDFEYDPATAHLKYIGEKTKGSTHLQICMGAAQTWLELSELLEDAEWKKMLADYGRFYYLDSETRQKESGGLTGKREFSLPFMAAAMGAYGAWYHQEKWLADRTWQILLRAMISGHDAAGFVCGEKENAGNQESLSEIPWISTNFVSQWCLNVIMVLAFIRDSLPETLEDAKALLQEFPDEGLFRRA